jgi:drug/metabolite transporter (DMT)-like permease
MSLRLIAAAALAVMFALVKLLDARGVTLVESLFYRQGLALIPVTVWLMLGPGLASVKTKRIGVHISRMVVGLSGMSLNFLGMILLPMTEATVAGFTVPIFATLLAILFLGERPGMWRWGAILLGFIGVLVVLHPDSAMFQSKGMLIALAGALLTAGVSILIRQLGATEPPTTVVFWFSLTSLVPLGLLMPWFGSLDHGPAVWGLLLAMGIVGGLAQIFLTAALRYGPVAVVLPMDYSSLIWSTLLGWLLFQTLPTATTLIGAPIIIASGLVILWRERVQLRQPSPVQ